LKPHTEDFLSQGPDDDFSQLTGETTRMGRISRHAKTEAHPSDNAMEASSLEAGVETPQAGGETPAAARQTVAMTPAPSDDHLLQDVMSTLLRRRGRSSPQDCRLAWRLRHRALFRFRIASRLRHASHPRDILPGLARSQGPGAGGKGS
jgi:hypothetical protein